MSKLHNRSELRFLFICAVFFGAVIWFIPSTDDKLTQSQCDKLIKLSHEKYLVDFEFDSSWDFENPLCSAPEIKILNALYFLDTTVTLLPGAEQEFDFYGWAKQLKPVLRRQDILAFSGIANFEENSIAISNLELEQNNPVSLSNIFIHELRHLEEGFNSHVPCLQYRNTTCDMRLEENLFQGGAYNYNVAYLHRLIAYSKISRGQLYSAKKLLDTILETRINAVSKEALDKYRP